jgi:proteasome lid subunit RPN8/RPN11
VICAGAVLDAIFGHAREALPGECCGLLVGTDDRVLEAVPIRNNAVDPSRYQLDPQAHIEARRAARRRGLDVIGFYHSHPRGVAEPSATDLAEATYPDQVYLIVSVRDGDTAAGERRFGWAPSPPGFP